jgi:PadR family transcriptional regulator, regulatory protein PadR
MIRLGQTSTSGLPVIRPVDTHILLGLLCVIPRCKGMEKPVARNDLQGSLDLLVLKTLSQRTKLHGYGIVLHIQRASDDLLQVEEGSIYPALHRMEQSGWISSEWGMTETNRKAKYYRLTRTGQKQLQAAEESFEQLVKGIRAILRYA